MLDSGTAGVSVLLLDLRASGVTVGSAARCMLLSTAFQEGWVQQQLALNIWLPLLSPYGDELIDCLGPSLRFVPTPAASGFKGAWCFDWRDPSTPPVLREWMRHRALTDARFDARSEFSGLCPADLGVHMLEGILLALEGTSSTLPTAPPSTPPAVAGVPSGSGQRPSWGVQLDQLRQALQALVVRYEATTTPSEAADEAAPGSAADGGAAGRGALSDVSGGGRKGGHDGRRGSGAGRRAKGKKAPRAAPSRARGGGRGFQRGVAVTAPALSAQRGVLRELLVTMDLQNGIRFGAQAQTAKVFLVALDQILSSRFVGSTSVLPTSAVSSRRRGGRRAVAAGGGGMTKRERKALDELNREGLVGLGAVDPSPQRTTVAVAACLWLLLSGGDGRAGVEATGGSADSGTSMLARAADDVG